jgi:hypothetical protein
MYNTRIPAKEFIRRLRPAGATERLLQPSPQGKGGFGGHAPIQENIANRGVVDVKR